MNPEDAARKRVLDELVEQANGVTDAFLQQLTFSDEEDSSTSMVSSFSYSKASETQLFSTKPLSMASAQSSVFFIDDFNCLHWVRSPAAFYLSCKPNDDVSKQIFTQLQRELMAFHMQIYTDPADSQAFSLPPLTLSTKVDFAICIGGDGSLLRVSAAFPYHPPPVALVNAGSLGFLAVLRNQQNILEKFLNGPLYLTKRKRLLVSLQKTYLALNEVYVHRGYSNYLTNLLLFINARFAGRIQADGLLVSTPTGSTAYALSAGGVPVSPQVECIAITPVCPHVMSSKQLIISDKCTVRVLNDENARSCATVSIDGRLSLELKPGEGIDLQMQEDEHALYTVCDVDQSVDFFKGLKECLNWNVRVQQKGFQGNAQRQYEIGDTESNAQGQD